MNEIQLQILEDLFAMVPKGTFRDVEELQEFIEDEGTEELFEMVPEGVFKDEEQFGEFLMPLKKKDFSGDGPQQPVDSGTQTPAGETPSPQGPGSSVTPDRSINRLDPASLNQPLIEQPLPANPVGTKFGANVEAGEKNTWLEEMLGKNTVTDFFGDMYRAGAQGLGQGATIDDARRLFMSGSETSEGDVEKYIAAVKNMDNYGMSDEMKSFNRIYERNGGGVLGFMFGVAANPTVIGQLFVSSVASMVNTEVLGGAAAGGALGATVAGGTGAVAGAIGGPIGSAIAGSVGAVGGGINGAILGASATLETGLAFTEFMKEEVDRAGLKFDEEGVRKILENPAALQSIRNKAMARGLVIGTIDAFTRGAASKLAGAPIKAAKEAGKAVTKGMKARAALKAAGIEAVGGSSGEATARAVTGQEMDVAEIGFEGITGQASSILSVPTAVSGMSLTDIGNDMVGKGKNFFKPPSYGYLTKKGTKMLMSKQDIEAAIDTMTDQEIIDSQFVIENDTALEQKYQDRRQEANLNQQTPENLQGERRSRYIELLQEKSNMENPDTPENQQRIKAIDEELQTIVDEAETDVGERVKLPDGLEKYFSVSQLEAIEALQKEGVENPSDEQVKNKQKELLKLAIEAAKKTAAEVDRFKNVKDLDDEEAKEQAKDQLISEGILEPTEQQINERANAIQESSATQVDVQESTPDSPEVGEGDAAGVVTQEGETQNQGVDKPIETQTQEEISVNVAPFFETSIESTTEAGGLRKSPQYQEYKQSLQNIADDLGVEIEIEESVGGYVNDAGTKIREVSNVVKLKQATLEQASQYAALTAALAPEVQESSIAAEYTTDGAENHNGNEITIKVSDSEGTFQALQEAGIDEYTLSETNNLLTLLDIFDFSDPDKDAKLEKLIDILDEKNITYEVSDKKAINSRFIDKKSRQQILSDGRQSAIQQQQEGSSLYKKIISAINRDAQKQGISPNEYIGSPTTPEVTADPNRVQNILNDIIKKTKGRKVGESTSPKKILDNTLKYLQNSKLYQQLNDTERNQLVRELNEKLGIKIKKAPSVNKLLGKPKDKKVVVNERVALKDQIRKEAKAARESAAAYKKSMKNIAGLISNFGKNLGKISQSKVKAITKRFANVNLNNKKSVDNFLTFVDNVFTKQDYVQRLNTAKTQSKKAKKQVGGAKTGVLPADLKAALKTLFSINPSLIPEAQLDSFIELAKEYGSGRKVPALRKAQETLPQALDIINAVQENLNEDIDSIKAEPVPDDFDVDATVKNISEKQKTVSESELNNIPDERAREDARQIVKMTPEQMKQLDDSDLKVLEQIIDNIKNGYAGKAVTDIATKLNAIKSFNQINPIFKRFRMNKYVDAITNTYSKLKNRLAPLSPLSSIKEPRGFLTERIRSLSTFFVDDVFGNRNSKTIYNNTFGKLARSLETVKSKIKKLETKIDAAAKLLNTDGNRLGITRNALVKKKYKLRILQLQREHESNFVDGKPNAKAPPAIDFINKTLEAIESDGVLNKRDGEILNELKKEFEVDGQISLTKIENSLTAKEKKALALYDDVNNSLASEAEYIAANLHGVPVELYNNYSHRVVLQPDTEAKSTVQQLVDKVKNNVNSTKSKTIVERTNNAKPISFDPGFSAMRGAQETIMDYEMTQTLREIDGTLNRMKEDAKTGNKDSKQAVNAIIKAKNELVDIILKGTYTDTPSGNLSTMNLMRLGYQATLGSVYRMGAEIIANTGIMLKNPAMAARAFKNFGTWVANPKNVTAGFDAMTNLRSSQTSKLYNPDVMESKHTQMSDYGGLDSKAGSATSRLNNVFGEILKYSGLKLTGRIVNTIASNIITFPDKAMSRPLWFGNWATNFEAQVKELTGEDVKITKKDFQEIADGTSRYLSPEFKEARDNATAIADGEVVTMATSNNAADAIIKNMRRTDDKAGMAIYRMANSFMARFSLFEFATARNAVFALFNKGDLSKAEAAGLLAGITFRMSAYMTVYSMLTSILDDELFDAEDDKNEDIEDVMARQLVGAVISLISRQSLGNIPVAGINYYIEESVNRNLLDDLRNGDEYDKYKHSIVFSQIGVEDLKKKSLEEIFVDTMAGPYGPMINTLSRLLKVGVSSQTAKKPETRQKAMDEIENRLILEVLGNLGLVPFYKDVRRVILKDMFPPEGPKLSPEQKKRLKEIEKQKSKRRPQRERSGDRRKVKNRRPKRVRVNRK